MAIDSITANVTAKMVMIERRLFRQIFRQASLINMGFPYSTPIPVFYFLLKQTEVCTPVSYFLLFTFYFLLLYRPRSNSRNEKIRLGILMSNAIFNNLISV